MSPQTFIFIGRSGCGKGTQAELLQKLPNEIYKSGVRQPDFIAIWIWAGILLLKSKTDEHFFFDGITRSLPEASIFTTAMDFYNRNVTVIYINVSRKWSEERLLARGRLDDKTKEDIDKRLDWFDKDSYPTIEYFNVHPRYT